MTTHNTPDSKQEALEPCGVCKFHWGLIVMPGQTHNPNCPHFNDAEKGCACQGCGQRYKVDVEVPDDLWSRIRPEGKPEGAGLLCGRCIFSRVEALGQFDHLALSRSRASVAAVEGDAEDRAKAIVELVENLRLQHAKRKHHGPFESCTSYSICALANRISVAAVSSPAPAEPPPIPNRICDYRNKECAAYGQTVGTRWICNNHICEQLQRCWLNAKRPAPAEPLQPTGEQEKL